MGRRRWIILGGFVLLAGAATLAWRFVVALGVGSFELTVRLSGDAPIRAVSYCSVHQEDMARRVAGNRPEANDADFRPARSLEGRAFAVSVRFTSQTDVFGFERAYYSPRYVVLLVEYEAGTKARKLVVVPPGRGDRSVEAHRPQLEYRHLL